MSSELLNRAHTCPELPRHAFDETSDDAQAEESQLPFVRLADLLAQPDRDDLWVWENRVRAGGVALLAGKPKAGKSTFARALAVAVASGSPFCGSATKAGAVWYLALEEHPDDVRRRFRRLTSNTDADIQFFFGSVERGFLARLHDHAVRQRPTLIIVDTLQRLAQMSDSNDYAQTTNAMNPILALARSSEAAVLLIHHARKGEAADPQDSIMGSLGITASTDCNLILARERNRRTLWSRQRTGPDLEETTLSFDEETEQITLGDPTSVANSREVDERILDALLDAPDEGWTETELLRVVGCKTVTLRGALRALVGSSVTKTGLGYRGSPL